MFTTKLLKIGSEAIIKLPKEVSQKLPSRGMVMVQGTINNFPFQKPLEPDGLGSHWFKFSKDLQNGTHAKIGDTVSVSVEPTKQWPEPKVPVDLEKALIASSKAKTLWKSLTPMARWDWIRWIGATKQIETRKRRIDVACSKLTKGMRRPCCFNRTQCTDPDLSTNGVLLEKTIR